MAKQEYFLIDVISGIVSRLSDSKPVYFQRDGQLFIATEEGFGIISLGLNPKDEKISPSVSNAIISLGRGYGAAQKVEFEKGEEKHINPIRFLLDDKDYSLEDISKSAKALSKLPDDSKIRMIQHWSNYHSHKYGYAADGEDVGLTWAKVMDREKYLDFFRMREAQIRVRPEEDVVKCAVITPDIALSLPTEINLGERNSTQWGTYTKPIIRDFGDASILGEQPFDIYIYTNSHVITAKELEEFYRMQKSFAKAIEAISSNLEGLKQYVTDFNKTRGEKARRTAQARHDALQDALEGDY